MDEHAATNPEKASITITLESALTAQEIPFNVHPSMPVKTFIQRIIDTLMLRTNEGQIRAMLRYYEPVLELRDTTGREHEVSSAQTLEEAGFFEGAVCRLAARPLKSEQLFCRYCG